MALLVPLVQRYCVCTDEYYNPSHLAIHHKDFEELRLKGMGTFQALEKIGVKRLCCREALFNPSTVFMTSENVDRIRISKTMKNYKVSNRNTESILPKRDVPDIPSF
jgi:DNA-directed RNA polymerase subunit N (RpoN/RPB10)